MNGPNDRATARWVMAAALWATLAACGTPVDPSLPVYTTEQTDSSHPGYRRTTVSTAGAVYVNDLEEQSLDLIQHDPRKVVGRAEFGVGGICAIEGQDPSAYLAVDMGSEMPAYEVFRNVKRPPFDWRQATFQKLRLDVPEGPAANKETTDATIIDDLLLTMRVGTPVQPPLPPLPMIAPSGSTGVHGILLFSDGLPGLVFRPWLYLAPSGEVYLADSLSVTYAKSGPLVQAAWIPASPQFARWAKTR